VAGVSRKHAYRVRGSGTFDARRQRRIFLSRGCYQKSLWEFAAISIHVRAGIAGATEWMVLGRLGHYGQCRISQQFHQGWLSALSSPRALGLAPYVILAQADLGARRLVRQRAHSRAFPPGGRGHRAFCVFRLDVPKRNGGDAGYALRRCQKRRTLVVPRE
jgi:hypothetical protein